VLEPILWDSKTELCCLSQLITEVQNWYKVKFHHTGSTKKRLLKRSRFNVPHTVYWLQYGENNPRICDILRLSTCSEGEELYSKLHLMSNSAINKWMIRVPAPFTSGILRPRCFTTAFTYKQLNIQRSRTISDWNIISRFYAYSVRWICTTLTFWYIVEPKFGTQDTVWFHFQFPEFKISNSGNVSYYLFPLFHWTVSIAVQSHLLGITLSDTKTAGKRSRRFNLKYYFTNYIIKCWRYKRMTWDMVSVLKYVLAGYGKRR